MRGSVGVAFTVCLGQVKENLFDIILPIGRVIKTDVPTENGPNGGLFGFRCLC